MQKPPDKTTVKTKRKTETKKEMKMKIKFKKNTRKTNTAQRKTNEATAAKVSGLRPVP